MKGILRGLILAIICLASSAKAQSDGPYVSWTSPSSIRIESLCRGKVLVSEASVIGSYSLKDPCTGEEVSGIRREMKAAESIFSGVDRYFVLSDAEGHYDDLIALLQKSGVINRDNRWSWGDGHLVLLGDMVDRGDKVTEVLWLIYRLEREAIAAGGRVHYLLGNHEKMILEGDVRYVSKKYEETVFRLGRPYQDLFSDSTELGRWLRTRNTILKLNEDLFVHAGLSPDIIENVSDLNSINEKVRSGLIDSQMKAKDAQVKWLLSSNGPLWYRGYFKDSSLSTHEISRVLNAFGANRVMVGHTIVQAIQELHSGLVIAVDTSFSASIKVHGLLYDKGRYYSVSIDGIRRGLGISEKAN